MQVTNPPIDPLREGLVMSLNMRLGKRGNLLQPGPGSYRQLLLETPILRESELEAIQTSSGLSSKVSCQQICCPTPSIMSGPASNVCLSKRPSLSTLHLDCMQCGLKEGRAAATALLMVS